MAIARLMGFADDAIRLMLRPFGRGGPGKVKPTYYEPFAKIPGLSSLAKREQRVMGPGMSGAVFGRPVKGLGVGLSHLKGIGWFAAGAGIVEGSLARRGHKASGVVGGVARTLAFGVGDVVGTTIAGPVGGFILGSITEGVGGKIGDAVQFFNDIDRNIRHINMGGNYEDTRAAYTMRQRAAQELGSSVMNARQWLGKEGALMHQ